MDKSSVIFGNKMSKKVIRKANKSKAKYVKKFGDDSAKNYPLYIEKNAYIGDPLGVENILIGEKAGSKAFDQEKGLIVGNIRMGFGHYRISMAIASAAHSMGYTPYWMDLNSYTDTTCGKVINAQNKLYSLGSRISGKSKLFNRFVWEPMNYEGFRKISYNAADQKNAELMAAVYKNVPKDIPVVATHVWPSQAAIHAGMKNVVNAIPDNWPMALHLSEGSLHTVQTHSSYLGYRVLNGMNKDEVLNPIPKEDIAYTGHYIDHELVSNIEKDCELRVKRVEEGKPMRFLLTIGGAGAQKEIFAAIIKELIPQVKAKKAALYVNVGDYKNVWDELVAEISELKALSTEHFDEWDKTVAFCEEAIEGDVEGIHGFYHPNIFEAVYATNLLMRSTDILVTKPSELAFYPIPKLFIKRVGGHEQWGAIHSAEIGDGTLECRDIPHTLQMIGLFLEDPALLKDMCNNIVRNKQMGIYDGAYKVVELAMNMKK
ncbi:hypothetical protein lbkm_0706 [Lachnospiraceae bacterium KM106-2]|nr:hypothetical protein lbkm_0706 [Lachnospiraceae bacterium KM106-2]